MLGKLYGAYMVGWIWTDVMLVGVGVMYGWLNGCIIKCVGINEIGSPRLAKRFVLLCWCEPSSHFDGIGAGHLADMGCQR
jgi:hypothetical protein